MKKYRFITNQRSPVSEQVVDFEGRNELTERDEQIVQVQEKFELVEQNLKHERKIHKFQIR